MPKIYLDQRVYIWFSKKNKDNTNEYLPLINVHRLIKHRKTYPNDTIRLLVDKSSLSQGEQKKLERFCREQSIILLDLADIKEQIIQLDNDDKLKEMLLELLDLARKEVHNDLGNPAAASDICRFICQSLELGIYADLDSHLESGWDFYLYKELPTEDEIKKINIDNCYFFGANSTEAYYKNGGKLTKIQINKKTHDSLKKIQLEDNPLLLQKVLSKSNIECIFKGIRDANKNHPPPSHRTKESIELPFLVEYRLNNSDHIRATHATLWLSKDDPLLGDTLRQILNNYRKNDPFEQRAEWKNSSSILGPYKDNPLLKQILFLTGPPMFQEVLLKHYDIKYDRNTSQVGITKIGDTETIISPDLHFNSLSVLEELDSDVSWLEHGKKKLQYDAFKCQESGLKIFHFFNQHKKEKYDNPKIDSLIPVSLEELGGWKSAVEHKTQKKVNSGFDILLELLKDLPIKYYTSFFAKSAPVLSALVEKEGLDQLALFESKLVHSFLPRSQDLNYKPENVFFLAKYISLHTYKKCIKDENAFNHVLSLIPPAHTLSFLIKFHQAGVLEKISKKNVSGILTKCFNALKNDQDKLAFLKLITTNKDGLLKKMERGTLSLDVQLPNLVDSLKQTDSEKLEEYYFNYLTQSKIAEKILAKVIYDEDVNTLTNFPPSFIEKFLNLKSLSKSFLTKLVNDSNSGGLKFYGELSERQKPDYLKVYLQYKNNKEWIFNIVYFFVVMINAAAAKELRQRYNSYRKGNNYELLNCFSGLELSAKKKIISDGTVVEQFCYHLTSTYSDGNQDYRDFHKFVLTLVEDKIFSGLLNDTRSKKVVLNCIKNTFSNEKSLSHFLSQAEKTDKETYLILKDELKASQNDQRSSIPKYE